MSLHGQTKGTPFEKLADMMAQGEANGTMMYYALARLAKEQGLDDVAKEFIEAANQEAVHAGFYAVLNGKYPKDFWGLVRGLMAAEIRESAPSKGWRTSSARRGLRKPPMRWRSLRNRKGITVFSSRASWRSIARNC